MVEEMRKKNRNRIINGAFKLKFLRTPNTTEFTYWSKLLQSGISLPDILRRMTDQAISNNPLQSSVVDSGSTIFVNDVSGSDPDFHQVLLDELENLPDDEFVETIYLKILGREADSGGKDHLLLSLSQNVPRKTLIHEMNISEEAEIYKAKLDRQKKYLESFFGSVTGGVVLSAHASRIVGQLTNAFQQNKQGFNDAHCH